MNLNFVPSNTLFIAYCFFFPLCHQSLLNFYSCPMTVPIFSLTSSPNFNTKKKCSLFSLLPEATIVKLPPLLHKHWSDLMQMFLQSLLMLTSWSPGHFLRFSLLLSMTSNCSSGLSLLSPSLILPHLQCWYSPEVFYRFPSHSTVSLAKGMVIYILMTSHLYI